MKKRILSLVLALSMMISLFPVSALAQTPGGGTAEMAEASWRRRREWRKLGVRLKSDAEKGYLHFFGSGHLRRYYL